MQLYFSNFRTIRNSTSWAGLHKKPILMEMIFDAYVKEKGIYSCILPSSRPNLSWKRVDRNAKRLCHYDSIKYE